MNNGICDGTRCRADAKRGHGKLVPDHCHGKGTKLISYVRSSIVQSIHRANVSMAFEEQNVARVRASFDSLLFPPAINRNENMCSNSIFVLSMRIFLRSLSVEWNFTLVSVCVNGGVLFGTEWGKNKLKRKGDGEKSGGSYSDVDEKIKTLLQLRLRKIIGWFCVSFASLICRYAWARLKRQMESDMECCECASV